MYAFLRLQDWSLRFTKRAGVRHQTATQSNLEEYLMAVGLHLILKYILYTKLPTSFLPEAI